MHKVKFPFASVPLPAATGWSARDIPVQRVPPLVRRAFEQMRQAHPKLGKLCADQAKAARRFTEQFGFDGFAHASQTPPPARQWQPGHHTNFQPNFQPYFQAQAPFGHPFSAWNSSQPYQHFGTHSAAQSASGFAAALQHHARNLKALLNSTLNQLRQSLERLVGTSPRFGFQQQQTEYCGQYGWHASANQPMYPPGFGTGQGNFQHNPFQYFWHQHFDQPSYFSGNPHGFGFQHGFHQNPFNFYAQPGYAGQSYGYAAPPPYGAGGSGPDGGLNGFKQSHANGMPHQPPAGGTGLNIGMKRSGQEWAALVVALQKKGMTRDQMAEWAKDFGDYFKHGRLDDAAEFNKKYAGFIDGDISDSTLRSNYLGLCKAMMKAVATAPA